MKEILTVYEVITKYGKGDSFENLRFTPIMLDNRLVDCREFELWMSQQSNDRKLLVASFLNVDFLYIGTNIHEDIIDSQKTLEMP